jgi:hypothetical protein
MISGACSRLRRKTLPVSRSLRNNTISLSIQRPSNSTKMKHYTVAAISFVLSPFAWVASGFQLSPMMNPGHREAAITMTSTKKKGLEVISRRRVLETSFVGGVVAAASFVSNPSPADAVCCHNKRISTLRDKRIHQQQLRQQFQLLGRRRDITQVGSSSSSHRRGIASAIMAPTSGVEGAQCALTAGE